MYIGNDRAKLGFFIDGMMVSLAKANASTLRRLGTLISPHMTTGKTVALIIWTFVGKVMSLLFNTLSRFVIAFLPRRKHLLISWLRSLSAFEARENEI